MIELFCFHCKKYFEWPFRDIKTGDYYRCPHCFQDNVLEGMAINHG